jgi:uncharacterized protein (DUF362 family)
MNGKPAGRTRREFFADTTRAGIAASLATGLLARRAAGDAAQSVVFRVDACPTHDGALRHVGVDALFDLLAENGVRLYRTTGFHPWGGSDGIIDRNDVVIIKVNCQWKCRGTTNTDVLRGVIHRVLEHPDGFNGEVVVIENGQGRGGFSGVNPNEGASYGAWPEVLGRVKVNAEDETLTVNALVNDVFAGRKVSSYLLDGIRSRFIQPSQHSTDGYRTVAPPSGSSPATPVSYPCFTTAYGSRIELREGRWTGSAHAGDVKLINIPVLKHHDGSGMTGALKHVYGILSMSDGYSGPRHYREIGSQCGRIWTLVRKPDLNILDCIWVSHDSLTGYPPETTRRCNVLLAGNDPVALDYIASKHILAPLGGVHAAEHDADAFPGLIGMLADAESVINASGGIGGAPVRRGDENISVLARSAVRQRRVRRVLRRG